MDCKLIEQVLKSSDVKANLRGDSAKCVGTVHAKNSVYKNCKIMFWTLL